MCPRRVSHTDPVPGTVCTSFCYTLSQEGKSKILNMKQLQPDSEFQRLLRETANTENCEYKVCCNEMECSFSITFVTAFSLRANKQLFRSKSYFLLSILF